MTDDKTFMIQVNGEQHQVPGGLSVAELLTRLGLDPARVAVERNRAVMPRATISAVTVSQGDEYEIVRFVGGG